MMRNVAEERSAAAAAFGFLRRSTCGHNALGGIKVVGERAAAGVLGVEDRSDGLEKTLPVAEQVLVVPVQKEASVGRIPRAPPCRKEAGFLHHR